MRAEIIPHMAELAHYVVVPEQGDYELYESKWGAIGLDVGLLAGPDVALSHFRASDDAWGLWRDEIRCEAAALVDLRHKVLLFFVWVGPTTTFLLRPAVREWLGHAWPGWDVRWAYSGLAELHEYLGLDPKAVGSPSRKVYPGWVVAPGDEWLSDPDPQISLVTIGEDRCHMVVSDEDHPVAEGPALLDRLADAPDHGTCKLAVQSGIHVDPVRRRVGWWLLNSQPQAYDMAARWPGWQVEFWQDRFDEHVRVSGSRFAPPPVDRIRAIDELRDSARANWPGNAPALAAIDAAWRNATSRTATSRTATRP